MVGYLSLYKQYVANNLILSDIIVRVCVSVATMSLCVSCVCNILCSSQAIMAYYWWWYLVDVHSDHDGSFLMTMITADDDESKIIYLNVWSRLHEIYGRYVFWKCTYTYHQLYLSCVRFLQIVRLHLPFRCVYHTIMSHHHTINERWCQSVCAGT